MYDTLRLIEVLTEKNPTDQLSSVDSERRITQADRYSLRRISREEFVLRESILIRNRDNILAGLKSCWHIIAKHLRRATASVTPTLFISRVKSDENLSAEIRADIALKLIELKVIINRIVSLRYRVNNGIEYEEI